MKKLFFLAVMMLLILYCLYAAVDESQSQDISSIRQAALSYTESWFNADDAGLNSILHKEFIKRSVFQDEKTGEEFFLNQNKEDLIKGARNYSGNIVPNEKRQIDITVLALYGNMASVRTETSGFIEYLHLAGINTKWKIINSLYLPRFNEKQAIKVDPNIYEDYIGIYEFPQGFKVVVSVEDNKLFFKVDGQPHFEALPESKNKYFFRSATAEVEFIRDASNKVVEMITYQPAGSLRGKKIDQF